ncbi:hypothetical protein I6E09_13205 [Mediterraneibacter glycyrrhizinilyticus]|uniref:DUF6291 domain-containing protein n=1 Tax=Mediterraneibacter glycyrrhizinilyticus TaxID=342942 RepID=UPI00265A3B29|nr:DUF6291 domain-containing protein [Mediterraneibacter glycyrrhizinilyticus]MCF2570118.1 hypothetical protein [Mediterraneibacter glycyrrhizinilyticus]
MSSNTKKSFLVYYDNEVIVCRLSDDEAGKLFKSLFPYGREQIKPDFDSSPALAMAFDVLSMAIDRDTEKYQNRCEKNRINGRKGGLAKANNSKQSLPSGKQGLANLADRDMDMDMDMDIDYKQIADLYNETCVSFPRVIKLSEKRKKAIRARLKTYTLEDFKTVFEKAEASDFLKGGGEKGWRADFDWMITDKYMPRILEGTYDNKNPQESSEPSKPYSSHPIQDFLDQTTEDRDFYDKYWGDEEVLHG